MTPEKLKELVTFAVEITMACITVGCTDDENMVEFIGRMGHAIHEHQHKQCPKCLGWNTHKIHAALPYEYDYLCRDCNEGFQP